MANHQPNIFEIGPRMKHGINTDLRPKERGCGQRPSRSAERPGGNADWPEAFLPWSTLRLVLRTQSRSEKSAALAQTFDNRSTH
jgi:hypothetical protein